MWTFTICSVKPHSYSLFDQFNNVGIQLLNAKASEININPHQSEQPTVTTLFTMYEDSKQRLPCKLSTVHLFPRGPGSLVEGRQSLHKVHHHRHALTLNVAFWFKKKIDYICFFLYRDIQYMTHRGSELKRKAYINESKGKLKRIKQDGGPNQNCLNLRIFP